MCHTLISSYNFNVIYVTKKSHTRVIHKVTLSLGLLSLPIPSFSGICKITKIFIKSLYEMLKLSI